MVTTSFHLLELIHIKISYKSSYKRMEGRQGKSKRRKSETTMFFKNVGAGKQGF